LKSFERANSHGETILAAFENKIRGRNHERFIGLAFVPLPISPFICATKAGRIRSPSLCVLQLKRTKVKVFELAPPATQTNFWMTLILRT